MQFGINLLNIVPVRKEASDASEMVNQILFGETLEIIETQKNWTRIKLSFDGYEGWIDTKQYKPISDNLYHQLKQNNQPVLVELLNLVMIDEEAIPVSLGANLPNYKEGKINLADIEMSIDAEINDKYIAENNLIEVAYSYLNTPYLWGGKSVFGIDCSGFTQMVYKINGKKILRDAYQQATQGEVLSFLEEAEAGDLAFFDNEEGKITHVGILLGDGKIIHAHGKVRVDLIDSNGIFNLDKKYYSHKLRCIKRMND